MKKKKAVRTIEGSGTKKDIRVRENTAISDEFELSDGYRNSSLDEWFFAISKLRYYNENRQQ